MSCLEARWPDWASFRPLSDCLFWALYQKFTKVANIFWAIFINVKVYAIILAKK
jgi:hypothetical protein